MDSGRSGGDGQPIRPASTVMLLRDGTAGLEVFALRRVAGMAFAGGMTAFPGGGVDPTDLRPGVPWSGPEPAWWADQWAIGPDEARGQVVAAVRELFEETGILLAGPESGLRGLDAARRESARVAVAAHRTGLAEALTGMGLRLRADLLRPWARWITPPGQSRRYDAYFFVAALPAGQRAVSVTTEAAAGEWRRPADALAAAQHGDIGMMPPTVAMMTDLAAASSVAEVLATRRAVRPVTPIVLSADGEVVRVLADGREILARRSAVRPRAPEQAPPGAVPLSRPDAPEAGT